ncbi:hypothetical protein FLAVO9AF_240001 [Flavobacterium sp. 9AF]|nr:hypothetical protein FLAVO9AF_240001 [Flavobacterium sp. 9AF]
MTLMNQNTNEKKATYKKVTVVQLLFFQNNSKKIRINLLKSI